LLLFKHLTFIYYAFLILMLQFNLIKIFFLVILSKHVDLMFLIILFVLMFSVKI